MNILFFNCQNSPACQVYNLWKGLPSKRNLFSFLRKKHRVFLVNTWTDNYSAFFKEKNKLVKDTSRIIVFGYKDFQYPIIRFIESSKYIGATWFDKVTKDSISIVFVPGGAAMLSKPGWPDIMNNWVSFKDKFDFLSGLPLLDKERKIIFPKIFRLTPKLKKSQYIKEGIENIFTESIERILKRKNDSNEDDMIVAIHKLRINRANLVYK